MDIFGLAGFLGCSSVADGEKSLLFKVFLKSKRFERRDIAFRYWLSRVKQISE